MTIVIVKRALKRQTREDAMANDVRDRMVAGAALLLAQHGLQATSFSEVLELTGAPRGSVYHHFPDGKDQMVGAAVDLAGARAIGYLDGLGGASVVAITDGFLGLWREVLTRSQLSAGCAVLAVTVATDSPALLDRAAGVFRAWRARLTELLADAGLARPDAAAFAATLVAASEGAVVISRAEQSLDAFDLVAGQLHTQAERLQRLPS
jgi:AcrR family transcriptional regulator